MNPDSLPSEMVLVPREPTTAMLRPFYECPPAELPLAWQAAMYIAERAAPQGAQPVRASDEQVTEWAARNDLGGTLCEWRAICEDAQTLLAASPADAAPVVPQEVRMLTTREVMDCECGDFDDTAKHLQRKFCEVNGLTIPAKEQP